MHVPISRECVSAGCAGTSARRHTAGNNRGQQGVATLSWLLIVATVAGLAGLAVVLVQATVEETGQQIANPNPRLNAALYAASTVVVDAKLSLAEDFETWTDWERHFHNRCALISVIFSDTQAQVAANSFNRAVGGTSFDPAAASYAAIADGSAPTTAKAQALCDLQ